MPLTIDRLTAGYVAGANVIDDISLDVTDGEIMTVIGPNGSGKSTLLKTIMGLVPARGGSITIDGADCTRLPTHRRVRRHATAYVPQLDNVFGPLSIRDNLRCGGQYLARRVRERRATELLDRHPALGRRPNARADSLSGGQRQLLAVCRALMPRPRLLLLDEPSAGLSPAMVTELFDTVADIRRQDAVTVLLVEQNATQALAISDRGVVLTRGRVAMQDRATTLLTDPHVAELYLGEVSTSDSSPTDVPGGAG